MWLALGLSIPVALFFSMLWVALSRDEALNVSGSSFWFVVLLVSPAALVAVLIGWRSQALHRATLAAIAVGGVYFVVLGTAVYAIWLAAVFAAVVASPSRAFFRDAAAGR